jgi:hypothetical protein
MSHDTESTSRKRKYNSAIDTSCAFETNDLNLTTANFDSYGNVSFHPCEFTLHTAVLRCYSDLAKSESMTGISQH